MRTMRNSKEEIDNLKPEDSWPQAEKMLDQHFRKKRLILILFIFGAAILLSAGGWFAFRNEAGMATVESPVVQPEKQNPVTKEIAQSNADAQSLNPAETVQENDRAAVSNQSPHDNVEKPGSSQNPSSKNKPTERTIIQAETGRKKSPSLETAVASVIISESGEAKSDKNGLSSSGLTHTDKRPHDIAEEKPAESASVEEESPITRMQPIPGSLVNEGDFFIRLSDLKETGNPDKPYGSCQASVLFYVMPAYVTRELKSENHKAYTERRNKEEEPAVMFAFGSAFTMSGRNFSISAGLEYAVYGENVKYSPYSVQDVQTDNSFWEYNTITVVDTDTVYISGIRNFLETLVNHTDSLYISDIDTTKASLYDAAVSGANGTNRFYFVEIPVEFSWHQPVKKFTLGASVGVSPGWLVEEKGRYIKKDLSGVETVSEHGSLNTFMLNARAGIDIRYTIGDRWSVFLKPRFKANLNSIFGEDSGISQKYYSTGIGAGFQYRLN